MQQNYFGFLKFIESTEGIIQAEFGWDEGMVSAEEMIVWNTIFSKSNHTDRTKLREFCLCIDHTVEGKCKQTLRCSVWHSVVSLFGSSYLRPVTEQQSSSSGGGCSLEVGVGVHASTARICIINLNITS